MDVRVMGDCRCLGFRVAAYALSSRLPAAPSRAAGALQRELFTPKAKRASSKVIGKCDGMLSHLQFSNEEAVSGPVNGEQTRLCYVKLGHVFSQ